MLALCELRSYEWMFLTHSHDRTKTVSSTSRPLWVALLALALYGLFEVVVAFLSHSLALVANAGHLFLDFLAVGMSLFAALLSSRPPTPEKTFGYVRAETLAALCNGAALMAFSLVILWHAYGRRDITHAIHGSWVAGVGIGELFLNASLLVWLHPHKTNLNTWSVWLHFAADFLASTATALTGIALSFGAPQGLDALISGGIAILILLGSLRLILDCTHVLLEGVPRGLKVDSIKQSLSQSPFITGIHDLHIWTLATGQYALSAHLEIAPGADASRALAAAISMLEAKYQIHHSTLQMEPSSFQHAPLRY